MDRITQLQDEIQNVGRLSQSLLSHVLNGFSTLKLLLIMSNTIAYLTSRANFLQVSPEVPVTKQRNPDKFDPPDVFEGMFKDINTFKHTVEH